MKKLIFIMALCVAFASCKKAGSFLDNKANTGEDENTVFTDSVKTMRFLSQIYSAAGYSFAKTRFSTHGNTEIATDDAEYNFTGTGQAGVVMYNGTMGPGGYFADFWTTPYTNIRRVNLMLQKLPTTPLNAATKHRITGELRFLRAWYYHYLVVCFGGVPLIGDQVYGINDFINVPRASFEESVNYVLSELDAAAAILPVPNQPAPLGYQEQDYGRVTRGTCLGLKSRVLLFAASPLFNGGAISKASGVVKPLVSYPTYSVSHWQKAADAALELMNTNYYSLNEDNVTAPGFGFYNVFLKRVNSEYIFSFNRAPNRDLEYYYGPPSRGGVKYSVPTHQLASAFPMKNGKAITDPTSGYDPANPFANRDPRFGYSFIYNQSLWYSTTTGSKIPVNTFNGAATDGYPGVTTTGYYARKMCDENISNNSSFNTERGWPLIRYAEILLNYAEAINETGQTSLAYPHLVAIRKRAGILPGADNLYGIKANMTVDEMRGFIQNERRVELMNEDQRWNDIRRWKIAVAVNNGFNKTINITKVGNTNTFTYKVENTLRLHAFFEQHYLMPIPQPEVDKMSAMVQNPGY